jgi:arylsulfatase A-like enzyme
VDEVEKEAFRQYLRENHRVEPAAEIFLGNYREPVFGSIEDLVTRYDAEVNFVDTNLNRLYRRVRKRLPGTGLWIVTADHGEGLGNHGWPTHGKHIYNEQVRVPLIVHYTTGEFAGKRVDRVVEHVDLFPTIRDHLGPISAGRTRFMGQSLLSLYDRRPNWWRYSKRQGFSERRSFKEDPRLEGVADAWFNWEPGETAALQTNRWKYILRSEGPDELFDLAVDPYETTNLVGEGLSVEVKLRDKLLARHGEIPFVADEESAVAVGEETIERLKSLGYVQ